MFTLDSSVLPGRGAPGTLFFRSNTKIGASATYCAPSKQAVTRILPVATSQGPLLGGGLLRDRVGFSTWDVDGVLQGDGADSTLFIYNGGETHLDYKLFLEDGLGRFAGFVEGTVAPERVLGRSIADIDPWGEPSIDNNRLQLVVPDGGGLSAFVQTIYAGSNDVAYRIFVPKIELNTRIHVPWSFKVRTRKLPSPCATTARRPRR